MHFLPFSQKEEKKKQKNLKLMLTIKKCFRVPPPNKTRISTTTEKNHKEKAALP